MIEMANEQSQLTLGQQFSGGDQGNFLDLIIVFARYKKIILGVTFGAAMLAAAISLLVPNVYSAVVRIFPAQQNQSSSSALLSQFGGLAGMAGVSLGIKNPNDLYVAMLKSRSVEERVAVKFGLQDVYRLETLDETISRLDNALTVDSGRDGVITIKAEDESPKRAADIANAFVDELDRLVNEYSLTEASKRKAFFEQQLRQEKDKLAEVEVLLDRTPKTSLQYLDVVRNFKHREGLYNMIVTQFSVAQLDAAREFPVIQIMDKAVPPRKKSKPYRSYFVALISVAAFILTVLCVFVYDALKRAEGQPEQKQRLGELRRLLRWKARD